MIADRASFSCVQFPDEWGTPKFKLGDVVMVDGEVGTIVGIQYESLLSYDPDFDKHEMGWWFSVSIPTATENRILKNVIAYPQDVIQPVLAVSSNVVQPQHSRISHTNTLEPLAFGVF